MIETPPVRQWNKHGGNAFLFEVLEVVDNSADLIRREQYWIDTFDAANKCCGFNMNPMAASPLGIKRSAETRAKIGKSRIYIVTDEMRARMSASRRGRKLRPRTKEHCAAISAARKGKGTAPRKPLTKEHKAKLRVANLGKKASEETKAKLSAVRKGKKRPPFTEIHKARISIGKKMAYLAKLMEGTAES